jgi:hypothetical protein
VSIDSAPATIGLRWPGSQIHSVSTIAVTSAATDTSGASQR